VPIAPETKEKLVKAVAAGKVSKSAAQRSRCSFCRAELGNGLELTIPRSRVNGQRASTGLFCSPRCRNCVLALAALHPSPLASAYFITTRVRLTDRLLELWRGGQGPDPAVVLEAANRASRGLPIAVPAVPAVASSGAQLSSR
jgi:hypothetical protein